MSKLTRVSDFQVSASDTGPFNEQRFRTNLALFASYEPVRLWLKARTIRAPFRKIVVALANEVVSAPWHGHVANACGVCRVTEAVAVSTVHQNATDHRWVLGVVEHALGSISRAIGWRSEELEGFVKSASEQPWPLVHFFERLACVDRSTGIKCVPWLSVRPGETQVGVRCGERDVVIVSEAGPLYLEDTFPLAKTAFRGRDYVLMDKSKKVLGVAEGVLPPRPVRRR